VSRSYLLTDEHLDFWRERHLCTVTTLRRDGSPHVVPMGIAVEPSEDGAGGFAWGITRRGSQKAVNLRRGDDLRVAVCQVDGGRWSTIEGTAEVLEDPESVAEAVRRYTERYKPPRENPERVAIRISITRITGNV
jgi:F420H(2)-dependent biliverdin reductase